MSLCPGDAIKSPLGGHLTLVAANHGQRESGNWTKSNVMRILSGCTRTIVKFDHDIKPSLTFMGWSTVARVRE